MTDFGDDLFAGAAVFYAKYRPKYPTQLFNDTARLFELDGHGNLLDLGCGTGELTLRLANYFNHVTAIDPDEDMLKLARQKAKAKKICNITWQKGTDKDLTEVTGQFKLATLG